MAVLYRDRRGIRPGSLYPRRSGRVSLRPLRNSDLCIRAGRTGISPASAQLGRTRQDPHGYTASNSARRLRDTHPLRRYGSLGGEETSIRSRADA